jgi:hypothetical protein
MAKMVEIMFIVGRVEERRRKWECAGKEQLPSAD